MSAARDYTGSCEECRIVEKSYKKRKEGKSRKENFLAIHTERTAICGGRKSTEKKKTLQYLKKVVSALRNSGGGQVLVHIAGQIHGDRYLEHFDEFITNSFTDLIEDGQLYVEAYDRHWLSEVEGFEQYTDFLVVRVKETLGIATLDFNSKVGNDIETKHPTSLNVAEILFNAPSGRGETPTVRGLRDTQQLHENRSIEIKGLKPESANLSPDKLVDYIWDDLKLKDNLTSMSKVKGGGSYYVGISEVNTSRGEYKTKEPRVDGFLLTDDHVSALEQCIRKKIADSVLVLQNRTFSDAPGDLVTTAFHQVSEGSQLYVLEVAVRFFEGLVFYDKHGPRTYEIQNNRICRVDKEEWLKRFEYRFRSCVCSML